jgi:hypothetical protein
MPQIVNFPNKIFSYLGRRILGFVWWNKLTHEIRNEFATHRSKFPSIWKIFRTIASNFLNAGLLILSLNYFKKKWVFFYLF